MGNARRFCFKETMQKRLLTFVEELYEDLELWYPKLRLEEAGLGLTLAAPALKTYRGKHGYPAAADALIAEVKGLDFCGLLIPGGFMPDKLRRDARVLALTREFFEQGKLVAFICHGGWIPISARILHGKRARGSLGIRDDLETAGAFGVDEPVVLDGNLISSRTPLDLPHFARAMVEFLNPTPAVAAHPAAAALPTQPKPGAAPQEHLEGVFKLNPTLVKKISH